MVAEKSRVILLSGSPLSRSLDWSEGTLSNTLSAPFVDDGSPKPDTGSSNDSPAWRSLDLVTSHLPTGLTPASRQDAYVGSPLFRIGEMTSTALIGRPMDNGDEGSQRRASTDTSAPPSQVLTQYYGHSFAVHEELQSSQIVDADPTDGSFVTATEEESFISISQSPSQKHIADARLHSAYLWDLQEIPNAAYLHAITPQTMTVNLVVGVISISQPRTIMTRNGGHSVELVEMLVGDETQAGFGINIWLPPVQAHGSNAPRSGESNNLRDEALRLRPRDVILIRKMALSSFNSKVYGQSLRKGMTTLDLLSRNMVDREDTRGAFKAREIDANIEGSRQLAKVKEVRDWATQFVGGQSPATKTRTVETDIGKVGLPLLPLDTQ